MDIAGQPPNPGTGLHVPQKQGHWDIPFGISRDIPGIEQPRKPVGLLVTKKVDLEVYFPYQYNTIQL